MAKTDSAGVKEYRELDWMPDYSPKDADILARLKIPPSPGTARRSGGCRGGDVLRDAARSSPELDAAVGTFF